MGKTITKEIEKELSALADKEYREFQAKLIPNVPIDHFIGVRTPELRVYAKQLSKREDISQFLADVPHKYFDEDQLHAFIISSMKDYELCMSELEKFLPYVDNWATCDQMSPKVFKKYRQEIIAPIEKWLASDKTYTVRFGVGMLMEHFLDDDFDIRFPKMVAKLRSNEYYINMMIAWYFATALAKQYDAVLPFIENRKLDDWTHNKTIRKCIESNRISPERKEYLRSLKIK